MEARQSDLDLMVSDQSKRPTAGTRADGFAVCMVQQVVDVRGIDKTQALGPITVTKAPNFITCRFGKAVSQ